MLVSYECPDCGHKNYDSVIEGDEELYCEQCGNWHPAEDVLSDDTLERLYEVNG